MPQLDASTFASQIFWLLICFGTLYYLLSRKALPRVSEVLEARQNRIAIDLDEAQRLRREAETALAEYEDAIAKARAEAQATLAAAQAELQEDAAKRHAELEQRLAKQLQEAEQRIAAARSEALREIEQATVELAQSATAKLAGLEVSAKDAKAALIKVLKEAA